MLKNIPESQPHERLLNDGFINNSIYLPNELKEFVEKKQIYSNDKEKKINPKPNTTPSVSIMARNLARSATKWATNGFAKTDEETLKNRTETCKFCEFWSPKSFGNTGRCMKCGCSTWAKLRMATEKCPIGKW